MNVNSYYEIGHGHIVCEDYALAEQIDDKAFIIVSDGCSQSRNTDVGARLVSIIARDTLLYLFQSDLMKRNTEVNDNFPIVFQELFLKKCLETKAILKLSTNTFDATLLLAFVLNNKLHVLCYGDGYVIYKTKDGAIIADSTHYSSSAPYYLSYHMSTVKNKDYLEEFGEQTIEGRSTDISSDGISNTKIVMTKKIKETLSHWMSYWKIYDLSDDTIESVTLSSDGIDTYARNLKHRGEESTLDCSAVSMIQRMIDYKNKNGEFVLRRMSRIKRDMASEHVIHDDDVSSATIIF